jgi:hypothetical protein
MADAAKPAVEPPSARSHLMQVAIVVAIGVVGANGVFFVFSSIYGDDHPIADLGRLRLEFATLTAVVAGALLAVAYMAREFAHGFAALTAAAEVVFGMVALDTGRPIVLGVTLVVCGGLGIGLAWQSYKHDSRAAWSFLIALSAVLALCTLFGAPKVRAQLGIGLWIALAYPALKVVTVGALTSLRDRYGNT